MEENKKEELLSAAFTPVLKAIIGYFSLGAILGISLKRCMEMFKKEILGVIEDGEEVIKNGTTTNKN